MWLLQDNKRKQKIERSASAKSIQFAQSILTAHELKNGREPDFQIIPEIENPIDLSELGLPSWAMTLLGGSRK